MPSLLPKIIQSWDTATKMGEMNDYSVCTTWLRQGDDFYLRPSIAAASTT